MGKVGMVNRDVAHWARQGTRQATRGSWAKANRLAVAKKLNCVPNCLGRDTSVAHASTAATPNASHVKDRLPRTNMAHTRDSMTQERSPETGVPQAWTKPKDTSTPTTLQRLAQRFWARSKTKNNPATSPT